MWVLVRWNPEALRAGEMVLEWLDSRNQWARRSWDALRWARVNEARQAARALRRLDEWKRFAGVMVSLDVWNGDAVAPAEAFAALEARGLA